MAAAAVSVSQPVKSQQELMVRQMVAGAAAGAVAKTSTAPLERIKILFQVQVRYQYGCAPARRVGVSGQGDLLLRVCVVCRAETASKLPLFAPCAAQRRRARQLARCLLVVQ